MKKDLLTALTEYADAGYYPFHMPGHKRNTQLCQMENPYHIDITEIDGFDNLHDAKGILKNVMEEAAQIYGAEETCFLVNGSSSGILTAICTCTKQGDEILIARNCHKSAYHALYLQDLTPVYLYPQIEQGIQSQILPEDVEKALREHPQIRAVMIVSPTYEGVVSDIEKIAKLAHKAGCPLIVDEAHGAHFGFSQGFPQTAVRLGADLVIQSVHKTLPAFTQTALLHVGRGIEERAEKLEKKEIREADSRIDRERLHRFLSIFQTSSPSYLFMAAIQKSLQTVKEQGTVLFSELLENIAYLRKKTGHLNYLHILSLKNSDPSKLTIFIDETSGKNGHWLYQVLLEKYRLQMEMESLRYVLAMTSIADTREGFVRLAEALLEIDQELSRERKTEYKNIKKTEKKYEVDRNIENKCPSVFCSIQMALDSPKKICSLEHAVNAVSAEYIYLYPPGIPLLVPGEVFTEKLVLKIKENLAAGLEVKGIFDSYMVYVI